MLTLSYITAANVLCRLAAVLLASWLSFRVFVRFSNVIAAFAAGLMLSLACTHLIPEALHEGLDIHDAGLALLGSFVFFVLLEGVLSPLSGHNHTLAPMTTRAVLLGGSGVPEPAGKMSGKALALLLGAACHNFVDGVLIASAFMVSGATGVFVTLAVFGHELPQMVGQLVILAQTGLTRRQAVGFALLAASASVAGGIGGWALLSLMHDLVGWAMIVAAASFIFVVLNILLPEALQEQCCSEGARAPRFKELAALCAGIVLSLAILTPMHEQAHEVLEGGADHVEHVHP